MTLPRAWVVAASAAALAAGLLVIRQLEGDQSDEWKRERVLLLRHQTVLVQRIKVADSAAAVARIEYELTKKWASRAVVPIDVKPGVTLVAQVCAPVIIASDSALAAKDRQVWLRDSLLAVKDSIIHLYAHPVVQHVRPVAGMYYDFAAAAPMASGGVNVLAPFVKDLELQGRLLIWANPDRVRLGALVGVEYAF